MSKYAIEFEKIDGDLFLKYTPEKGTDWIHKIFDNKKLLRIKNTFFLEKKHLNNSKTTDTEPEETIYFSIATLKEDYFHLCKEVMSIEYDLYIHKDIKLTHKLFVAEKNISIFKKFNEFIDDAIYIGGNAANNIPDIEFQNLIKYFPNSYELKKYASARVSSVIREYLDIKTDKEIEYQTYLNKKIKEKGSSNLLSAINAIELKKYDFILEKLNFMLTNENNYTEKHWQDEIMTFICLLYPKYIKVFKEVEIWDEVAKKKRRLDFLLIDSSGHADIIEIKKPMHKSLLRAKQHRENYVPTADLSNTVMQVEKYIYHLSRWGSTGEKTLTKRYENKLPKCLNIKIINPVGIIIMGRKPSILNEQIQDFEIIKRKYKNVMDIITYDDLLNRLQAIISTLTP